MLNTKYRLNNKDINYMIKRGNKMHDRFFTRYIIPQYPNRPYHQISFHISKKLAKSAVVRRSLKRPLLNHLRLTDFPHTPVRSSFFKIFVISNKKYITDTIADLDQDKDALIDTMLTTVQQGLQKLTTTKTHHKQHHKTHHKPSHTSSHKHRPKKHH